MPCVPGPWGYQWNIMWLDTFCPLLPMVMLGMISLLQTRRFFLYTVTLFLSVASNYYIGFFTCIFVALCFLPMRFAMVRASAGFWETWGLCSSFSLLAIALTAFLEWPAYVALGTTNSSVNEFPHYLQPEHCQRGFLEGGFWRPWARWRETLPEA